MRPQQIRSQKLINTRGRIEKHPKMQMSRQSRSEKAPQWTGGSVDETNEIH